MPDSGTYCLVIRLRVATEATIGKLGRFRLPKGYYVYCGSAMRGLGARVARHMRQAKKLRWHIDHLLALPWAQLIAAHLLYSPHRTECKVNRAVQSFGGAAVPIPGFGSSDCTSGCPAHLTHFPKDPHLERNPRWYCLLTSAATP